MLKGCKPWHLEPSPAQCLAPPCSSHLSRGLSRGLLRCCLLTTATFSTAQRGAQEGGTCVTSQGWSRWFTPTLQSQAQERNPDSMLLETISCSLVNPLLQVISDVPGSFGNFLWLNCSTATLSKGPVSREWREAAAMDPPVIAWLLKEAHRWESRAGGYSDTRSTPLWSRVRLVFNIDGLQNSICLTGK